jgi:phosphatidylinositol-3-phosphatase
MRRLLLVLIAVVTLFGGLAAATRATPPSKTDGVPQFGNVFVIIGENTDYSALTKNNAPYLLGTIKPESAWLTNYWATTHYSESNYVAMTSGQFTACQQADGSIASCHQNVPNLFNQLGHGAWTSWMESMPSPCYIDSFGSDAGLNKYRAKHNPALIYDDVTGSWSGSTLTPSADCLSQNIPAGTTGPNDMSTFNQALKNDASAVSRFNYIVPNECEDAHDNCKPAGNPVLQFDQFLQREVPLIQDSDAYKANGDGVIIVTFDEGTTKSPNHADKFGQGGNVAFAVISNLANTGSYGNMWDHYSFLRTLQDGLGTSGQGYLGDAANSNSINTIWK